MIPAYLASISPWVFPVVLAALCWLAMYLMGRSERWCKVAGMAIIFGIIVQLSAPLIWAGP